MLRVARKISAALFAAFVLGGLWFGLDATADPEWWEFCLDDPGEVGYCPPLDADSCIDKCHEELLSPYGECENRTQELDDCCQCVL